MPANDRLQLDKTFDAQRNLVNSTIVPTVMNALDSEMFPVGDGIVYKMIHNRHKHQREEYLKSLQSSIYRDE
jgi:hypothetical protein